MKHSFQTSLIGVLVLLLVIAGCSKFEEQIWIPVEKEPLTVTIVSPAHGQSVSGKTLISVLVSSPELTEKVELIVDGELADGSASYEAPFELEWNTFKLPDKSRHEVTALATSLEGMQSYSRAMTYSIDNSGYYPVPVNLNPVIYENESFLVTWPACSEENFAGYTLFESFDPEMDEKLVVFKTAERKDTSFTVNGIVAGETRYYLLETHNSLGLSSVSRIRPATAPGSMPEGLVAYYPFNGDASDETGLGHDGTVSGAVLTSDRFGNTASAYSFQGNEYIEITDHEDIMFPGGFTLAAWVKPEDQFEHNNIISKVNPNRDFVLQLNASGLLNAHFYVDPDFWHLYSPDPLPLSSWTHVAYVYQERTMKLYIDGQLVSAETASKDPVWTGTVMLIGAMNYEENFVGSIDEVMVFNRALDAEEVFNIFSLE